MKQFVSTLLVLLVAQTFYAQKLTSNDLKQIELSTHKKIVTQALTYNDMQTAINSIHTIIILEGDTSTYKDSLAITYFNDGNYVSSHLLAKELLQVKPNNTTLLEINAVSLQNLNATKEAITAYEILFANTNNMIHGYQLANLQHGIKRLAEAQETIQKTLACKEQENAYIRFSVDNTQTQNVPLKAAAYNLQGLIEFELKDNLTANTAFNKALEIMPNFTTATQNAKAVLMQIQREEIKGVEVKN